MKCKDVPLSVGNYGVIEHVHWSRSAHLAFAIKAFHAAEQLLAVSSPYRVRLERSPVQVVVNGLVLDTVRYGATLALGDQPPLLVITDAKLRERYRVKMPDGLTLGQRTVTTRRETTVMVIGEEMQHLSDNFSGLIPPGEVQLTPESQSPRKYENKAYETRGLLFRFKLLAALLPQRWGPFFELLQESAGTGRLFEGRPYIRASQ